MLQREAVAQAAVHFGIEEAHRLAPVLLGAVERGIGVGEQRHGVGAVVRIDGGADAEADGDLLALHLEWLGDGLQQAARQRLGGRAADRASPHTSVNSSPPMRAMKSPSAAISSRRATAHSSSSPTTWPNTSLASLK